ncbi:hypothetical protein MAPG_10182 [Magnaporthiopsis poae ATCC 64411]|uniref:HRQ family protein 2 n=1 Tax=Magnaporthiopsis poae (strain ATCC 64411 / 73-15) TaxID=644358 RepID=A0A0C4EBX0_MAGP6|nr:hypothetical protein MAPG_10182 [Magnaporthiopsis poae ATCC 64411]
MVARDVRVSLGTRMSHWTVILALLGLAVLAWAYHSLQKRAVAKQSFRSTKSSACQDKTVFGDSHPAQSSAVTKIHPLKGFRWDQVAPKAFRPFKPIYHITMGIQSSTPSELIEIDCDYHEKIKYRRRILSENAATVTGSVPEGVLPARELYRFLLAEYLPARYPDIFTLQAHGAEFRNSVTQRSFPMTPPRDVLELLRILGENVEDDLFLLVETPEGHRMVSFVCCHPSGFDPSAKLGKLLKDIHEPVPAYDKIGASMERFFSKLEAGEVVKRLNWGITTVPELFTPGFNHVNEGDTFVADEDIDIDTARFRVELQALSRLPKTDAILFSFKSYLYYLSDIKEEGLGPSLADAIEGLKDGNAPGMWVYKGAVRWGKGVCEYLRA